MENAAFLASIKKADDMYDTKRWYERWRSRLRRDDVNNELEGKYVLLLQVELGLRLLERLQLLTEPAQVLWIILSDPRIIEKHSVQLCDQQRHMLARARILLPFSGRFSWENALREYAALPLPWRLYDLQPAANGDLAHRLGGHDDGRINEYDRYLDMPVPYQQKRLQAAQEGQVSFDVYTPAGLRPVSVDIPAAFAAHAADAIPWFQAPHSHIPLHITHEELEQAADEMDRREADPSRHLEAIGWRRLLENTIHYRIVQPDGSVSESDARTIDLDGMVHIAGMVGSGKSILMKMIATHAYFSNWRVTLVVNDTMSALELADYFNCLLSTDDEHPIAVALLGRTQRHLHMKRLYQSRSFQKALQQQRVHWALRQLHVVCPLAALASSTALPEPLLIGEEPCEQLRDSSQKLVRCPLFACCPSQQLYRDMVGASIWITTPGAMGSAGLPASVEPRRIKIGELVYEQSDLVIFDEVDAHQGWFDDLYAPTRPLFDSRENGLMDRVDIKTSEHWASNRAQPSHNQRWILAERNATQASSQIISQLSDENLLRTWVGPNYFTAFRLFRSLAYHLLGQTEASIDEETPDSQQGVDQDIQLLLGYFEWLMEGDPAQIMPPSRSDDVTGRAVYSLSELMDKILSRGNPCVNVVTARACREWIEQFVPRLPDTLASLEKAQRQWDDEFAARQKRHLKHPEPKRPRPDDIEALVKRLGFALCVAALDRNMLIVFSDWRTGPEAIVDDLSEHRHQRPPGDLLDHLYIPPTGKLFGFYYHGQEPADVAPGDLPPVTDRQLTVFEYTNIGRQYLLEFHRLFTDLDEQRGPNVLALSGTSWLPASSRWHFDVPPKGVLQPNQESERAIAMSLFEFHPVYELDENGQQKPLSVSGEQNMREQLGKVTRELCRTHEQAPCIIKAELDCLEWLGQENPDLWRDRGRALLLVNSYSQAQYVANKLVSYLPLELNGQVFALKRSGEGEPEWALYTPLGQSDIESFGQTQGKLLVAPMQAIGRGYNILNEQHIAAFGAIYFLVRPLPPPFDVQTMAASLNRKTAEWYKQEDFEAWKAPSLYEKGLALRQSASRYWQETEAQYGYRHLEPFRKGDLAASTVGLIIQACGRLLRGGVPFHAYFIDAAWGPNNAIHHLPDTPQESLLAAMMKVLSKYLAHPIGARLYSSLAQCFFQIKGFEKNLEAVEWPF